MTALPSSLERLAILILYPHARCNCRCVMCDIWKTTDAGEVSAEELARHLDDIDALGVEQVVFSGGEPLMHADLFRLAAMLRERGVRTTLLTTGLLLRRYAQEAVDGLDEIIVSLDGPQSVHNRIRRVPDAYWHLYRGVEAVRGLDAAFPLHGRCTVQRENREALRATVRAARRMGLSSLSFLAADLDSEAFNRPGGWDAEKRAEVGLTPAEADELECETEALLAERAADVESGFVRESPEKLRRIVRSLRGEREAPRCTAPWVSAVLETDGTLRPCFFHPPIGNWRETGLREALNGPAAVAFRERLDVASDPVCRGCVCSLDRPVKTDEF